MQKITYVGPFDAVEFEQGSTWRTCERDESIEVTDSVAESLLEQGENWAPVKAPVKKAAAKSAQAEMSEED
jgi:hypothetical protein